jgi:uncharacterized protein with PQ loop repeat
VEHAVWFGWVGGVLLVGRVSPQVWRIWRTGQRAGVSRAGVWCWLGNDVGWFAYGVSASLAPLWVSSAVLLVLDVVLLAQLGAHRGVALSDLGGVVWAAVMGVLVVSGSELLSVALVGASVAGTVPHAVSAVRSEDVSGVSPAAWRLAGADGLLWLVYGAAVADALVVFYATLTLMCAIVILLRIGRTRLVVASGGGVMPSGATRALWSEKRLLG